MYSCGLYPLINKPTRVTLDTATIIDNIYTNNIDISYSGILIEDDISDHLPVFTTAQSTDRQKKKPKFYKLSRK